MAYFELTKSGLSVDSRFLPSGDTIEGQINGSPKTVTIIDGESLSLGQVVLFRDQGAIFFDRTGRFSPQRGIVYLPSRKAQELIVASQMPAPGAYKDGLVGLYKRLEEQLGRRDPNRRSFWERIEAEFSVGWTEVYRTNPQ